MASWRAPKCSGLESYRIQGALYRDAMGRIVGPEGVCGVTFVFVSESGFVEVECPEVDDGELFELVGRYLGSQDAELLS